jgi:hypothetical protein
MTSLLTFTGARRVREVTHASDPFGSEPPRPRRREGAEGYEKAIEIDALRPINRGGRTIAATKPNSRQMATKVIVGQRNRSATVCTNPSIHERRHRGRAPAIRLVDVGGGTGTFRATAPARVPAQRQMRTSSPVVSHA